jgi:zinc metalloprotease ZmpA
MKKTVVSAATIGCLTAAALVALGTPQAATSAPATRTAAAQADARANARAHAGVSGDQGVVVRDTVLDRDGGSHVRFERTYRGLEVVGGDLVVHQGAGGSFDSVSGRTFPAGISLATSPTVSARAAARTAGDAVHFTKRTAAPELVVLAVDRKPALAWRVDVTGRRANGAPAGMYEFVSARSGRVLDHWPSVLNDTGSGTGLYVGTVPLDTTLSGSTYQMIDPVRGGNSTYNGPATSAPLFTDADNVWGNGSVSNAQTAAVDAHFGIAKTWDYYKSTFNRSGIANDGKGARSFVHDGAYVNASWSDSCFCMRYGDGDGTTYLPLVELDIAGHEMSHGVTSRTAGLTYRGESGGLNEATSDIMGTNVEFYAANAGDPADYVIGEEIFKNYNPATNFIRRMDRPSADGASLDCYNRRAKSVDVHYSSGIANHFFYLLSEGTGAKTINGIAHNSTTCNGTALAGIGRDAAQQIWYRALTVYMTSSTVYAGARTATISAATDLYGAASLQTNAVKAAWSGVSVN